MLLKHSLFHVSPFPHIKPMFHCYSAVRPPNPQQSDSILLQSTVQLFCFLDRENQATLTRVGLRWPTPLQSLVEVRSSIYFPEASLVCGSAVASIAPLSISLKPALYRQFRSKLRGTQYEGCAWDFSENGTVCKLTYPVKLNLNESFFWLLMLFQSRDSCPPCIYTHNAMHRLDCAFGLCKHPQVLRK